MNLNHYQILKLWEASHQRLSEDLREKFLARTELQQLTRLPADAVRPAIHKSPRLDAILIEARRLADQQARKTAKRSATENRRKRSREARQRNAADYVGNSTLRRAGRKEGDLRERCSSCGLLFHPASPHDC